VAAEVRAGANHSVLVTAVRNEAPFLCEWIAYHKRIGFSRIVVLSNTSDDGTEELLSALAAAGEIAHYHVDPAPGHSPQYAARITFEEQEGYIDGAWYMWMDADEFLNIHVGQRRLPDLLAKLDGLYGIHLNWRIFGTSGHKLFPGRFVSRDFPGASKITFAPNRETKSLFRKAKGIAGFAPKPARRPLLDPDHQLTANDFLTGVGQPLIPTTTVTQQWFAGDRTIRTNTVLPPEMGWTLAQINHYSVRTPEFFALKAVRGRGAARDPRKPNDRHTPDYFKSHDRNGQTDLSIAVWEDEVTQEIARLLQIPEVALASRRSEALVRAALAARDAESETIDEGTTAMTSDVSPEPAPEPAQAPAQAAAAEAVPEAAPEAAQPAFALTFPREEAAFVRKLYAEATSILEYGSGGSTVLATELGKRVISVESDLAWSERLAEHLAGRGDAHLHHVDIGPTVEWGMPENRRQHGRFHRYALSVWDRPDIGEPDLVLIDGRFRASCLVAVLLRAKRPTTVLFDDYENRPHYHGVERLARKVEVVNRMALFAVTPGPVPPEMLTEVMGWFVDPR
jgi:hypothetical protein